VAGSWEHGYESQVSVKVRKFLTAQPEDRD